MSFVLNNMKDGEYWPSFSINTKRCAKVTNSLYSVNLKKPSYAAAAVRQQVPLSAKQAPSQEPEVFGAKNRRPVCLCFWRQAHASVAWVQWIILPAVFPWQPLLTLYHHAVRNNPFFLNLKCLPTAPENGWPLVGMKTSGFGALAQLIQEKAEWAGYFALMNCF